nr:HAD hydrolase-like protein [Dolichospermum flos-aquae]
MRPKSIIELTENLKYLYIRTAKKLKGSDRRQFMAEVVKGLGIGGQTLVERELGWNRRTIRKGMQELESGQPIIDGFDRSGRKGVETKLPNLLLDMKSFVMVGDSEALLQADRSHDIIGAKKNNIASIGVTYGYGTREELEIHKADLIADYPDEIPTLLPLI